jgi:hypothetical protein
MLHLTKVAVGCRSLKELTNRQAARVIDWHGRPAVFSTTRFMPKRADELIGGSICWIVKHMLIARQEILAFEPVETKTVTRCNIMLDATVVPILATPLRAHQGWRYRDTLPPDVADMGGDIAEMPTKMMRDLTAMGLI